MRAAAILLLVALPVSSVHSQVDSAKIKRDIDAGKVLVDQWIGCSRAAASQLAPRSAETADILAVAVLGACSPQQEQVLQHLLRTMTAPQADDLIAKIKMKIREQVIAQVVALRAK